MRIERGKIEIIEYSYKCDLCGKETISSRICSICGRNICSSCTKFDPRDIGDYPTKYCLSCFEVGEKYLDQIVNEEKRLDKIVEELEQKWKDEAIKQLNKSE